MITDELIKEKLSRKEARELLSLTRKIGFPAGIFMIRDGEEKIKSYFEDQEFLLGNLHKWKASPRAINRQKDIIKIWSLYKKVSDDTKASIFHWNKSWNDQKEARNSYSNNAKPIRQDNKTYINRGNGRGYLRDVRKPKKNRKTAWKRFYKLFPELKPKEDEKDIS